MSHGLPSPQCFYFGPENQSLFGVWHAPQTGLPAPATAVLMLAPWGAEDMSAHRVWRGLALVLAAQGHAVLRFEYDGCGDSYDPPEQADHWLLWQASALHAIAILKQLSGAGKVVVLGMRLGALLAAELARTQDDIAALVLLAPIRSGQAYLRELKMLAGAMGQADAGASEGVFSAGFALNAATAASLKRCALPERITASDVTMVDRDDASMGPHWTTALAAQGVRTHYEAQPGFPEMMLTAHRARPAQAMFDSVMAAINAYASRLPELNLPAITRPEQNPHLALYAALAGAKGSITETVLPLIGTHHVTAILVLNSGGERGIGPNRIWVAFARDRASRGDVVVRINLPGLGESTYEHPDTASLVHPARSIEYLMEAHQALQQQLGIKHWAVMGLCSGAYHSLRLCLSSTQIEVAVVLNAFLFSPEDAAKVDLSAPIFAQHAGLQQVVAQNTLQSVFKIDRWLKLLRGQANAKLILSSVVRHASRLIVNTGTCWAQRARLLPPTALMRELIHATSQGRKIHFIVASTDPAGTLLRNGTNGAVVRLIEQGLVTEDVIDHADHTFSQLNSRSEMLTILNQHLDTWKP
jgi:pimeloyl-ACP methyl ester carboxylesterase